MSIFKCKMCGGTIEFEQGATVGVCDSCGTKQTLPKTSDDVVANLFNRANNLRLKCEFDKAEQIYEKIVEQDDSEAEAHWGIVLCKYGIEYVEDPKTFQRIPTCHRTLFDAVTADPDYLAAIDYSDLSQQALYESEARAIDRIQKDILAIVKNEKPFDVFICYKETDENGKRTVDSAVANDIYYQLTQEGFKVFYAAITLEDKLGQEYEPYIFAALNSAKVMLVIGTRPEYYSAVWVKNEWSRYLKLMKTDRQKLLIPCYRDMDAYDLPEEFAHLQAQDMGKIGFINDIVRGIKKVIVKDEPAPQAAPAAAAPAAGVEPLLERVYMFLEDGDWTSANDYCEKVLDIDPKNARAYLGKLMVDLRLSSESLVPEQNEPLGQYVTYQKALRFADPNLKVRLENWNQIIVDRVSGIRFEEIKKQAQTAKNERDYQAIVDALDKIIDFADARALQARYIEQIKQLQAERCCQELVSKIENALTEEECASCIESLQTIVNYKDSRELLQQYEGYWEKKSAEVHRLWDDYYEKKEENERIISRLSDELQAERKQNAELEETKRKDTVLLDKIAEKKKMENALSDLSKGIDRLRVELSGLGIFASKKKNAIRNELNIKEQNKLIVETGLRSLVVSVGETQESDVSRELSEITQRISESVSRISQLEKELVNESGHTPAIDEGLLNRQAIAILAADEDVFYELIKNERALSIFKFDEELQKSISCSDSLFMLPASLDIEAKYYQACMAYNTATGKEDIIWARAQFKSILGYRDSKQYFEKCNDALAEMK